MIDGLALAAHMIADLTAVYSVLQPNKQGWIGKERVTTIALRTGISVDRAFACLYYLQAHGYVEQITKPGNGGGTFWRWVK